MRAVEFIAHTTTAKAVPLRGDARLDLTACILIITLCQTRNLGQVCDNLKDRA